MSGKREPEDELDAINRQFYRRVSLLLGIGVPAALALSYGLALAGHPTYQWGWCQVLRLCSH